MIVAYCITNYPIAQSAFDVPQDTIKCARKKKLKNAVYSMKHKKL